MSNKKGFPFSIFISLALVLLLVLAAIVARPLFLVICVVLVFVYIFFYSGLYKETPEENKMVDSPALKEIRQSIKECDAQLEKLHQDIVNITDDISDMSLQLEMADDLRPEAVVEGRILISRFEEQLALRKTKITFYNTCKQKLSSLEANHLLALKLQDKQKKLQALQENQYEELASMESLKVMLEREVMYLKTIDQLSLRMLNSQSLQEAEALKIELVAVTEELRNL